MFETLNDRGLKVSQADLVKNFLFGRAEDRLNDAQAKWTAMASAVEMIDQEDAVIDYLRIFGTLLYGLTRERQVFDRVKSYANSQATSIRFLNQLENFSTDYVAMLSPYHQKWNDYPVSVRQSLATLLLLDISQIRHLLLAVSHYFSKREAEKSFRLFVSWIVRMFVAGSGRVGRVEAIYAQMAHDIHEQQTIKTANDLSKKMAPNLAPDKEFRDAFLILNVSKMKLARYYLSALERAYVGDDLCDLVPNEDTAVLNLEHVLSQNLKENASKIEQDLLASHGNRLGNLVLLNAKANSHVGNETFDVKKKLYTASALKLTQQVAEFDKWGATEIELRQQDLAALAVKTWSLRVR
jgi:hypothetical protein